MFRTILILSVIGLFTFFAIADEAHHHAMPPATGYGSVHFPTSCSATAQPKFERAVAMLHSFGYDSARDAFLEVGKQDPRCAMAWWGVAMTQYHGLWRQIWPAEGAAAIAKARTLAKTDAKTSPRELAYIAALGNIFDDPQTPLAAREL